MKIALAYFEKFIEMSGGIERVCCNMANAMVKRGHDVSIIYCYGRSGKPFYALDPSVKVYNLMALHPEKWKKLSLSQCVSGPDKLIREIIRAFAPNKARDWNESVKGRMILSEIQQVLGKCQPDIIVSLRFETGNYLLKYSKCKNTCRHAVIYQSEGHFTQGSCRGIDCNRKKCGNSCTIAIGYFRYESFLPSREYCVDT